MTVLPAFWLLLPLLPRRILHIPELLPDVAGGPDNGYQEIEYESIQQVKYDYQKKYLG